MKDQPSLWPQRIHVARVKVCAASGDIPRPRCRHTIWTWFVPKASPIAACDARHAAPAA